MQKTSIEWCDYTSNPFKAIHIPSFMSDKCPECDLPRDKVGKLFNLCEKISPGCAHCYACALTHRWGGPDYIARMKRCYEPVLVEKELRAILRSRKAAGGLLFSHDMTDLFWEFWPDSFLDQFFAVVALRPDITFQLLTKRAERMHSYFRQIQDDDKDIQRWANTALDDYPCAAGYMGNLDWPLPNLWLGVSVEDQKHADERVPLLLQTPASVRWISAEPLLARIDLNNIKYRSGSDGWLSAFNEGAWPELGKVNWVVVGGESGPGARPFDVQWARDVIAQCKAAGTACFIKQLGARPYDSLVAWKMVDRTYHPTSQHAQVLAGMSFGDCKGGDIDEWPEELRVRQSPSVGEGEK